VRKNAPILGKQPQPDSQRGSVADGRNLCALRKSQRAYLPGRQDARVQGSEYRLEVLVGFFAQSSPVNDLGQHHRHAMVGFPHQPPCFTEFFRPLLVRRSCVTPGNDIVGSHRFATTYESN
jgi:hypothetical protein